ncbi:MAG: hypothetical protein K5986_11725 [Clostridium sp.]|nr:hypothetical protein [Clostridium sp.]
MKINKKFALVLSVVMVLGMSVPVSAAEREDVFEVQTVSEQESAEFMTAEEVVEKLSGMTVTEAAGAEASTLSCNGTTGNTVADFANLSLQLYSAKTYAFKTKTGTTSMNGAAYLGAGCTQKLKITDQTGHKVKGMKSKDVQWKVFSYSPAKNCLVENPAEVKVKNGSVKCEKNAETNSLVYVFATYGGETVRETFIVRPKTIAFLQIVHGKARSKASAVKTYSTGTVISVDNIQSLVGTSLPTSAGITDTIVYASGKKTTDMGFIKKTVYTVGALPLTTDYDDAYRYIYKASSNNYYEVGAYDVKVSNAKNITPVKDRQGNITAFVANKPGTYTVSYVCNDGSNKKFSVKVKVN